MKKTPILVVAAVLLLIAIWIPWAWNRNAGALETAHLALEKGDHGGVLSSLDRMTVFPLNAVLGYTDRAAELRDLAGRMARAGELPAPAFLELEVKVRAVGDRFPGVLAQVAEHAARRLREVLPDPLFVSAENVIVLPDRYPVAHLAIAGHEVAPAGPGRFDATGLVDAATPRPVRLEDPHGFALEAEVRLRVDREAPVIGTVDAPAEVRADELFTVRAEAGEPVFQVAEAKVEGGRMVGVSCRGSAAEMRVTAGRPPGESGVGVVAWSFRVADAAGNRSVPVMGRTTSVSAERADRIARLGGADREEVLATEAWVEQHRELLPDSRKRVAAEVERRLHAVFPDPVTLDARRRLRLAEGHPVAALEIDGNAAARNSDGTFHAAGLTDQTLPRRVRLIDPHGFSCEGQLVIRVDDRPPVLRPVDLPGECEEDVDFLLEYEADEPLGGLVGDVTVTHGRLVTAFVDGKKATIKVHTARLPPGTENGRLTWAFIVRDRAGNASEEVRGACTLLTDYYTNSIGMKFKRLPSGEFLMGSEHGYPDEKPVRTVKIEKPFYIGVFEVTQAEWEKVMGRDPSGFDGARRPVESVSWYDVQNFIRRLSEREGVRYRLPTEAEWEYACRAGTRTLYYWGDTMDSACAWFWDNSGKETHPVGLKAPNPWGLYDMSGNVFEWCGNEEAGDSQVARGGSWRDEAGNCRSARRLVCKITAHEPFLGFRVVR